MKNPHLLVIVYFFVAMSVYAQERERYRFEIDLGHDNDFLIIYTSTDRYYTYGINAAFRWLGKKDNSLFNRNENYVIHYNDINVNIEAYTPDYLSGGAVDPNEERPYAGWSYVNFTQAIAFESSYLHLGVDAGIMGPDSKAGKIQNWFHREISGDAELEGWENQLPNQFGMNLRATYGFDITSRNWFNVYTTFDGSVGNMNIYARPAIHFRFGKFLPIQYSVAQNNQLLGKTNQFEFYIDSGFGAKVSAYNATVQGNIFDNNDLFKQDEINNLIFNGYFGICFQKNKFSFQLKYHLSTGELMSSEVNRYAALGLTQRF